jgi:endonuclease/exonuclease/phosphatase family metal-dependent hydrolase
LTTTRDGNVSPVVVATYNVHRCSGGDGRRDAGRIAEVVRELDADLVGLQEIDSEAQENDSGFDQLAHVASQTGYTAIPGPSLFHRTGGYGNALLSRWPVTAVRRYEIGLPRREPRAVLDVEVKRDAHRIRTLVTHFGLLGRERRLQSEMLLRILAEHVVEPTIVLGDFNEWLPLGRSLRRLQREFGASDALRTFPARLPLFALDRIWVRPRYALIATTVHHTPLARLASDHLPVQAKIKVVPRRTLR